jgi:hypothetical protein
MRKLSFLTLIEPRVSIDMPPVAYPPPWMDKATLCEHICLSERTVDAWVKQGLLPPPRLRGGKLM